MELFLGTDYIGTLKLDTENCQFGVIFLDKSDEAEFMIFDIENLSDDKGSWEKYVRTVFVNIKERIIVVWNKNKLSFVATFSEERPLKLQ